MIFAYWNVNSSINFDCWTTNFLLDWHLWLHNVFENWLEFLWNSVQRNICNICNFESVYITILIGRRFDSSWFVDIFWGFFDWNVRCSINSYRLYVLWGDWNVNFIIDFNYSFWLGFRGFFDWWSWLWMSESWLELFGDYFKWNVSFVSDFEGIDGFIGLRFNNISNTNIWRCNTNWNVSFTFNNDRLDIFFNWNVKSSIDSNYWSSGFFRQEFFSFISWNHIYWNVSNCSYF